MDLFEVIIMTQISRSLNHGDFEVFLFMNGFKVYIQHKFASNCH